jgi:uncharacterized iron-regulated membrane protein
MVPVRHRLAGNLRTLCVAARDQRVLVIHRYLGLVVGAWFVLLGLTGSILVYQDAIDAWLNPALLTETIAGEPLPAPAILAAARAQFPEAAIERMRVPQGPGEVYRFLLRSNSAKRIGSPRLEATFGAVSGRLLGTRMAEHYGLSRPYLLKTIYDLHHKVLLGNNGKTAVGIVGLALLTTLVIGLILAIRTVRSIGWRGVLGIKRRAATARVVYDVHRSLGVVIAGLLILSTLTGFTLVFPDYARSIVGSFSKVAAFPVIPWQQHARGTAEKPFDDIWRSVIDAYPSARITEVHMPLRASSGYVFYLLGSEDVHRLGDTLLWIDPRTAERLLERNRHTRSGGEAFLHWLFPLHSGIAFGAVGKVAMCTAGVAPAVLLATGIWLWRRKRRSAEVASRRARMRQRNIVA